MLKRTVVIADAKIINNFKLLCKTQGRIPGKVIEKFMEEFIKTNSPEKKLGKKA